MSVLALKTVAAETALSPVLAHLSFVLLGLGYWHHLPVLHKRQKWVNLIVTVCRCCWVEGLDIIDHWLCRWHEVCSFGCLEGEWVGTSAHVVASM